MNKYSTEEKQQAIDLYFKKWLQYEENCERIRLW